MSATARPPLSIEAFENGSIDVDAFDHEAHVYIAWLCLDRFELSEAIGRFDTALRALTARLGIPDKYHATITWFFILLIAERRAARPETDWFDFRRRNRDLFAGRKILHSYYTPETLASDRARRTFVLPDRRGECAGPGARRTDELASL
jgi:hypothetical protein